MKKTYFISFIIPLVFISQEVFASSYSNGFYSSPSPSTTRMNINNAQLQEDTKFYNSELNNEFSKIQKSITQNQNTISESQDNRKNLYQQQYQPQQQYPRAQYQLPRFYQNQPQQPQYQIQTDRSKQNLFPNTTKEKSWWRQENSYQGWGFD